MIITVASGKGGTGKTTVAVSLALSLADGNENGVENAPLLLDCDVEEPNIVLFLHPSFQSSWDVGLMIPQVDYEKCTYCGRCAEVCQYHAIAAIGQKVLVFPELCHGCGSCTINCEPGAISERLNVMGSIDHGWAGPIEFAQGTMDVGQPIAGPIIRQLKQKFITPESSRRPIVLDAPPGAACTVVESMKGADLVLLVTEPTPFGLHDLKLAVQVARGEMNLPVAVVINRYGVGDSGVEAYCAAEDIPILMVIPLDRQIARAYSEGIPLVHALPEYKKKFIELYKSIEAAAVRRAA